MVCLYSAAQMAAFCNQHWVDIDCKRLRKQQVDSIVFALQDCGHYVEVMQKISVLKSVSGNEVSNTTVLRIETFPAHVRENIKPIWEKHFA